MTHQGEVLLAVNGLKTYFNTDDGVVKSVDGVTFHIKKGETLAVGAPLITIETADAAPTEGFQEPGVVTA